MRCNRNDCFAYNIRYENSCEALYDNEGCSFYKSREELYLQLVELKEKGKPQYIPSVTRQDQRRLKALLQGRANAREERMDKT